MRISSSTLQLQWLASFRRQQAALADVQRQLSSGRRVETAADDPIGMGQMVRLQAGLERLQSYATNAETARRRLAIEEETLGSVSSALDRIRELAIQAGTGTQTQENRNAIASEVRELLNGILDAANAQDGEGRYLFAGNLVKTQPFVTQGTAVSYQGDDGQRFQRISDQRTVAEGDSGERVFTRIRNGNGTFAIRPDAGNQGGAFWTSATTGSAGTWVPDTYTLSFTDPATWTVTDSDNNVVATGSYVSGGGISFNGVSLVLEGEPAAGDSFTISPSSHQSVFDTVQGFLDALAGGISQPEERALFQSRLNATLQDLDQAMGNLSVVRSEVGARLAAIDQQLGSNDDLELELNRTLSGLRDVDYAKTISDLEQRLTSLEAAQKAFARTRAFSLFDVL
jgi:flagellar hook-associated protein 3 FlgL